MPARKAWSPGDLFYDVRLVPQSGSGGAWVYLTKEHLAAAVLGEGRTFATPPKGLVASRTVLEPGTGQILIRIKRER